MYQPSDCFKKYIERAEADFGFIMTAYNLRRIINIVGMKRLWEYMERTDADALRNSQRQLTSDRQF